jgi:hypothetical protein
MNKKLLTTFLVAAVSSVGFAQVSFGPKLGLGISRLKETKTPSGTSAVYNAIVTPQVGAVVNFQFGDYVAFRPELLYMQRGAKTTSFGSVTTVRISYIELPINVAGGLHLGPGRLELFAGPSLGLVVGGKSKTDAGFYYPSQTTTIKGAKVPTGGGTGSAYVNPLNVSLNFGVDYKFDFGLLLQVGYNLGLSNMNPHYADSYTESFRKDKVLKSSSINIGAAYLFGGKK